MKREDFIKKLSELTKIDVETMTNAITSELEDIEIEFPKLETFTKEDLDKRDLAMATKGNKTAVEQAIKKTREKIVEEYGDEFNFEGKIMDNLVDTVLKIGEKQAGIEPNKKIEENKKVIKTLQDTLKEIEVQRDNAINDKNNVEFSYQTKNKLFDKIPNLENSQFTREDLITLWESKSTPTKEDGIIGFTINGELQRDEKTQEIISYDKGFESFLLEKGVAGQSLREGRGDGDSSTNSKMKHADIKSGDDFYAYSKENKLDNKAQVQLLKDIQKENPEFSLE